MLLHFSKLNNKFLLCMCMYITFHVTYHYGIILCILPQTFFLSFVKYFKFNEEFIENKKKST